MEIKKILVVDDEKNIRRLVEITLQRAGYTTDSASDGIECLEKVAEYKPDLIVLDWMMPKMSGIKVLQNLKSNTDTASIPVIMLTAKAQDLDVLKGWQAGVDCFLVKPYNPMELLQFVKRIAEADDDFEEEVRFEI